MCQSDGFFENVPVTPVVKLCGPATVASQVLAVMVIFFPDSQFSSTVPLNSPSPVDFPAFAV